MNGNLNENAKGTEYAYCIILLFDLSDGFKLSYCISLLIEYKNFNVEQSQGLFFFLGDSKVRNCLSFFITVLTERLQLSLPLTTKNFYRGPTSPILEWIQGIAVHSSRMSRWTRQKPWPQSRGDGSPLIRPQFLSIFKSLVCN